MITEQTNWQPDPNSVSAEDLFGSAPLTFGQQLRCVRQLMNCTQTETAKRLGISKQLLSAYETDKQLPSITKVVELAKLFEYPVDFLLEARTRFEFKKAGFDVTVELKQVS
jgi:transcriptional regulator with XRE-family HTH domain